MADKKFTLTFDANMDVSKVKKSVSEIQSALNGLNLSKGMASSASGTFKKLLEELDNYNNLTSQAATSMADIKKADKSLQSILALFDKINNIAEEVGANPINFINPAELKKINAAKKALESAKQAMSNTAVAAKKANLQDQFDKAKKKVDDLNDQVGQLNNKISSKKEAKIGIETSLEKAREDLAQLRKELASLEANPVKAETKTTSKKGVKTTENLNAQEVEDYKNKLNETKDKISETERAINQLNKDLKSTDTSKMEEELEQIEQETKEATRAMNELGEKLKHINKDNRTEAIKKLRDELADLTGKAKKDIPQTIDKIEEFIESLSDAEKVKVAEALNKMNTELAKTARESKNAADGLDKTAKEGEQLSRTAQDIENLKNQVLDFFSISNTIQIFKNAVRDAFDTVKELDAVMTETAVVTDFSIGDMWDKLPEYAEQANKLGTSIKDLYAANTLYYQQGLNSQQAMSVGVETMKMARIANMDAAKATEAMTAALRGFNMEINETSAGRINDVYSELAAITASDTEQIATAMSKTASIAASANMEFETTAALLAQIIETTQEAPETAGTAMKTIIARFTEVKELFSEGMITGEDSEGEEININKIDEALKTVGISLRDFLNGTKGIDDIFLELASKWDSLDLATQRYIATAAAGSRQQSRFIAMMSNYDRTMELVTAANNSAGASQKQFNKTLESLDAKLQRLKNAWDTFTMGLANNELIKVGVDLLTKLLETVNNLTDDLGGVVGGIAKLGIAIAGLKVGKSVFNAIFDISPLQQSVGKVNSISNLIAASFKKIGVSAETNVTYAVKRAQMATSHFASGLTVAGVACGVFAQYLKSIGLDQFAKGLEAVGGLFVALGSGISLANSVAQAFGKTVKGLAVELIGVLAPILPCIIAIGVAIAAVVTILKKVYDNSIAGKLKAAQKSTQSAAQAAQDAADAYTNLKNALDSIEDRASALSELTRGTNEWREAVIALNSEVLALADTYPELQGFIANDGGVLRIDYEKTQMIDGKEQTATDVLNSYLKKQTDSQRIYNQRQIREKEAESNNEYSKQVNKLTGILYEGNKEYRIKETGDNWDKTKKAIDDLATAIAKGQETDEESLIDWFQGTEFNMIDYEDFDYSVFKQYGDYLLNQQEAINGLTDATIAAQIAMTDFSNNSQDAVEATSNFDTDVLRESYNQIQAKNLEATYGTISQYVEEMGYYTRQIPTLGDNIVKYYSDKERTQEVTFTDQDVRDYFTGKQTEKDFEGVIRGLANHFDKADDNQREMFNEIFTDGVQELSFSTLRQFGKYENEQFSLSDNQEVRDNLAKSMGFADFSSLADALELGADELAQQLSQIFTEGGAEFIKTRKNLVKNMTKYSTGVHKDYDVNATWLNLLEAKYKDLDVTGILTGIISQLELTGDEEFSTAAYESLRDIMLKANGSAEMEDALNFFKTIDFSNPIDALDKINEEIRNGTGYSKELATTMKGTNSLFLGLSSQLSTLFTSTDFEDVKEDLDEIIEKNGDISAMDVFDLTKSYKSLDKVLKNNEITAEGLAEILEQIADGTVKVDELTDTVLAAMSSFESLNSIAAKSVKFFEDFDLGIDESTVGESIIEFGDLIMENIEKGAVGNSQNFRILDTLFPGWDDDITTAEARVAEMARLGKLLQGNGQNLRKMWTDMAAGKDYKGDAIQLSAEHAAMGLTVRDTGSEIIFEGWEGKDLTSVDLVSWIADAYGTSTEMAEAILTDFKNYSGDLADELRANDYAAGIEKAYETLHKFGDLSLIDEREIETIAKLLGVDSGTIKTDLEARGATVTQFYKDDGEIKKFEDIKQIMDVDLAGAGAQAGQKWSDSFMSAVAVGNSQGGGLVGTLNLSDLEKELKNLGITGLNADKLKQQAFEAMRDGLGQGAQMGYGKVQEILANGDTVEVTITPNMSWEEYQQQVTKLTQQNENNTLADAIGKSITESLANIELEASINENTLLTFRESVENTLSEVDGQISVSVSEDSQSTMDGQIAGVTDKPRETPVDIRVKSVDIGDYLGRRTVYVDIVVDKNEVPAATGGATSKVHEGSGGSFATGIKNAPRDFNDSLVSEEGPELIQKANGGAYLSGTEGPEIVDIEKGDTVYTAEETKNILKSRTHDIIPRYASGYGYGTAYSGGKNVGSKSDDDKEDWVNSFDKLYNLVREIDEELRQRERLERRYEKLLESVDLTADKLFDNAVEQLKQLEKEKLLQKELQETRRQQISQYQSENSDLMKYAKIVQNERGEDVLRIHWDQINLVEDPEQGQRIEDYVSQLEEWMDGLNDIEDELNDIEDRIEEVKEIGKDEYLDLENAIKDAVAFAYQEEIDKLSEINESINDTNTQLIDAISKQVNRIRQQRENENTERELQEKQRQLQYLQQDTSGANAMEILQLQKEIAEGQQDYTDTLIDQKISELQEQNDEAATQREQQITLMQAQLDHLIQSGEIWDEVYALMDEGLDPEAGLVRGSRLEQLLKSADGFDGMSKVQQMDWLKELQQQAAQAVTYMRLTTEKLDTSIELNRQNYFGATTPEPEYSGSSSSGGGGSSGGGSTSSSGGGSSSGYTANPGYNKDQIKSLQEKAGIAVDGIWGPQTAAAYDKGYRPSGPSLSWESESSAYWSTQQGTGSNTSNGSGTAKKSNVQITYGNGKVVTYSLNASGVENTISYWASQWGGIKNRYEYKTGGLADFTGPAWLDGTKSRPELVLNARDTQNFIQLKDILASVMDRGGSSNTSTENNGDITYDIDINVESIGSDYDVEQVANKVKSMIGENARYRNNNTVSLAR